MSDYDEPVAILEVIMHRADAYFYKFQRLNKRHVEINGITGLYAEKSLVGFYKIGTHNAIKALF